MADYRGTGTAGAGNRIGTGLYGRVVEVLGQEIIDGTLPVGSLLDAEEVCDRLSVSRSVMREGIRTLGAMGLVEARPQVGTRVLPSNNWNLLSPQVVRWRGQGPGYLEQMQQLLELRLGLEHAAAGLSAERLSSEKASEILDRALEMQEAFEQGNVRKFFEVDADFHRIMLSGTGNAVISQLADTIGTTLDIRGHDTRPGMVDLNADAVDMHISLARALVARSIPQAQKLALELVQLTLADFKHTRARI